MMVNTTALMNATPGAQTAQASMETTQGGDFTAALEKTQQLLPSMQEGMQQPVSLPAAEALITIRHELQGDVFDSLDNLPDNILNDKPTETADGRTPVLADMSVESQLMHLQALVMQMDAANAAAGTAVIAAGAADTVTVASAGTAATDIAAGNAQQASAAATAVIEVGEREAALANIAQAVLTTRKSTADNSNAAPASAVLAKQSYSPAQAAGRAGKPVMPATLDLPAPMQLERPEQTIGLFKPVVEGALAIAAEGHSSFTPAAIAHVHTAPGSLQPASHAASVPVTATPAPVLTQEMGTLAWQQSLGQQLAMFTRNGIHNAEIRLNPAELGAIKINLRINNDQASLHFVSENHQVRAALEAAMPQLRSSLAESGISLETSRVDSNAAHSWGGSAHSEWASEQSAEEGNAHDAPQADAEDIVIRPTQIRHASGINTFV